MFEEVKREEAGQCHESRKERPSKRGGGRFEPYGNPSKNYRVFVSNIPYDVRWQALKDLMRDKDMDRGIRAAFGREFGGRSEMGMSRNSFGDSFDRGMGSGLGMDRMDRVSDRDRMGSGFDRRDPAGFDRLGAGANARKGCQIFVRNLPLDFTWMMLKDAFSKCGMVQYAHIKRENGKSRGCGVVRFDNPETAERACSTMNGVLLNGQEIGVWMDRYF